MRAPPIGRTGCPASAASSCCRDHAPISAAKTQRTLIAKFGLIEEGFDAVVRTGEARDSRLMMRHASAFGQRIAASSDYLAARGTLVGVLEDHLRDVGAFHILWPASRHPSPKVAAFVGFMAENLLREPQAVPCRSAA